MKNLMSIPSREKKRAISMMTIGDSILLGSPITIPPHSGSTGIPGTIDQVGPHGVSITTPVSVRATIRITAIGTLHIPHRTITTHRTMVR
jgi:preprotein translocase subunit YajC